MKRIIIALVTAVAAWAAWACPAPARDCAKCSEPASDKWKFCPYCGAQLPALTETKRPAAVEPKVAVPKVVEPKVEPEPVEPKAVPAKVDERPDPALDFRGDWQVKDGVYTNKAFRFRFRVPAGGNWTLIGDPKEAAAFAPGALAAFTRRGGIAGAVIAERRPDSSLDQYAAEIAPTGIVAYTKRDSGTVKIAPDGEEGRVIQYQGRIAGRQQVIYQLVAARGDVRCAMAIMGAPDAFHAEISREVEGIWQSFAFLGKPISLLAEADAEFTGPFAVLGDVYKNRERDVQIRRPSAAWKFLTGPKDLAEFPEDTVVALSGPDGLHAAVIVIRSSDDLGEFARKTTPALTGRVSEPPSRHELDGRPALRVEHRGRFDDASFTFVQLLAAGPGQARAQVVIWGPGEAVDRHRKAIAALQESFRFRSSAVLKP